MKPITIKEYDLRRFLKRCRQKEAQGYEPVAPFERKHIFHKEFKPRRKGAWDYAGRTEDVYYEIYYKKVN